MRFHLWIVGLALIAAGTYYSTGHAGTSAEEDYDRLDGVGPSGKKVDVIEWEGNLEIHVYPKGSLSGVGLKLDGAQGGGDQKVMVIAYRFNNQPTKTLIRRYILGIPLGGFKPFQLPDEECDKLIISRNTLAGAAKPYKLDAEPTQLFPDGHPMLAQKEAPKSETTERKPAAVDDKKAAPTISEDGGITPFFK